MSEDVEREPFVEVVFWNAKLVELRRSSIVLPWELVAEVEFAKCTRDELSTERAVVRVLHNEIENFICYIALDIVKEIEASRVVIESARETHLPSPQLKEKRRMPTPFS